MVDPKIAVIHESNPIINIRIIHIKWSWLKSTILTTYLFSIIWRCHISI